MRSITPRYSKVIVGADIFPVDKGLVTLKMQNQNLQASSLAEIAPVAKKEESFLTTPLGATLSIGAVIAGLYYLGKNAGTTRGKSSFG